MQRGRMRPSVFLLGLVSLPLWSPGAAAQIAISANDGKAVLVDGVNTVPAALQPITSPLWTLALLRQR